MHNITTMVHRYNMRRNDINIRKYSYTISKEMNYSGYVVVKSESWTKLRFPHF